MLVIITVLLKQETILRLLFFVQKRENDEYFEKVEGEGDWVNLRNNWKI